MFAQQIAEIEMAIEALKAENGERYFIKQMEKTKKSLNTRLSRLNDASRKDNVVTFEQFFIYKDAECSGHRTDRSAEIFGYVCKVPVYG